ncbi:MAG: FKBP-type peptidyl-prolyl cis-trans isomerase [Salibacteraceae bacterium]
MNWTKRFTGLLILGVVFIASCKKEDDPSDYTEEQKIEIKSYIAAKGWDADSTSSGLYYVVDREGTGKRPSQYSDVLIRYKGELLNGTVFDESTSGARLNLSRVIEGWKEGVPKFKEGGHGWLLIPSRLGYGNQTQGAIPSNSVLIFEIYLDEVF